MARFTILLIALVSLLVLRPFLEGLALARALSTLLLSAALLSALYGVSRPRWVFRLGLTLAVPALVATWLPYAVGGAGLLVARNALLMLAFAFTAVVMVLHTLRADRVGREEVAAAVSAYLLLGLVWGLAFALLDTLAPGSIALGAANRGPDPTGVDAYVYYSFVTLTTLGYGDVTPVTGPARALSFVEAAVGQLFLAVLIAKLIGLQVARVGASPPRS